MKRHGTLKTKFEDRVRVVRLVNNLEPHSLPLCESLGAVPQHFRVFVSGERDEAHGLPQNWGSVNAALQHSVNFGHLLRRAFRQWEWAQLQIPYDTYQFLGRYFQHLIVSAQLGVRTTVAAFYRNRHPKVKLILSATLSRSTEKRRSWIRVILRKSLIRQIDGAFVNGSSGEQYLKQLGYQGLLFSGMYTIKGSPFEAEGYSPELPIILLLYVGRLAAGKGLQRFIASLIHWCKAHQQTPINFRLIGEVPDKERLMSMETPPGSTLVFTPQMSQSQLAPCYGLADISVFPSLSDEWCVVVNEAPIASRLVLGTIGSQAVTELIAESKNGWLFDPLYPQSIMDALARAFASTEEELRAMSANAEASVESLTLERVAQNAVAAFRSILEKPNDYIHPLA